MLPVAIGSDWTHEYCVVFSRLRQTSLIEKPIAYVFKNIIAILDTVNTDQYRKRAFFIRHINRTYVLLLLQKCLFWANFVLNMNWTMIYTSNWYSFMHHMFLDSLTLLVIHVFVFGISNPLNTSLCIRFRITRK